MASMKVGLNEQEWSTLVSQAERERLLPVIGDRFFWEMAGGYEPLIRGWLQAVNYPGRRAARGQLAEYVQLRGGNQSVAKNEYLRYLQTYLLNWAESSGRLPKDILAELRANSDQTTVSAISRNIGLETLLGGGIAAYRTLAASDLPVYITTSYHDFLEQALEEAGKTPRPETCRWRDDISYETSPVTDFNPSQPLVFHLFGLDSQPESLVLTEEDHLVYLTRLALDPDIVPPQVRQAMALSSLLLLGYQMRDWDFRVVYRGLIVSQQRRLARLSVATQPEPEGQDQPKPEGVAEFVKRYFEGSSFSVYWGPDQAFLEELAARQRSQA